MSNPNGVQNLYTLLEMPPEALQNYIQAEFTITIPVSIETTEDLRDAIEILGKATSFFSFLSNAALYAKLQKRKLKREKADKEMVEDALAREEIFTNAAGVAKAVYNGVSRMVTIKQMLNSELKMTDSFSGGKNDRFREA